MKLKLKLEDLSVDSFDTMRSDKARGTVFGEQCTCPTACSCPGCPTCDASCNGTCDPSCAESCLSTCDVSCLSCNTCEHTCDGDTCGYTCDSYCAVSRKYTNCDGVCY